ncbi:MAG: hypothetical protein U0M33_13070 [Lachnospiraceae bacterium]|nr:hypothetical protein [Lachnospiraceae bacterium]
MLAYRLDFWITGRGGTPLQPQTKAAQQQTIPKEASLRRAVR